VSGLNGHNGSATGAIGGQALYDVLSQIPEDILRDFLLEMAVFDAP
jgi:hypothetical protein